MSPCPNTVYVGMKPYTWKTPNVTKRLSSIATKVPASTSPQRSALYTSCPLAAQVSAQIFKAFHRITSTYLRDHLFLYDCQKWLVFHWNTNRGNTWMQESGPRSIGAGPRLQNSHPDELRMTVQQLTFSVLTARFIALAFLSSSDIMQHAHSHKV